MNTDKQRIRQKTQNDSKRNPPTEQRHRKRRRQSGDWRSQERQNRRQDPPRRAGAGATSSPTQIPRGAAERDPPRRILDKQRPHNKTAGETRHGGQVPALQVRLRRLCELPSGATFHFAKIAAAGAEQVIESGAVLREDGDAAIECERILAGVGGDAFAEAQ